MALGVNDMGFFQSINPFYWRAKAQELEKLVDVLGDAYETCRAELIPEVVTLKKDFDAVKREYSFKCEENEQLRKTVQSLSVQYEYPTKDDICSGVRQKAVNFNPVEIVGESPAHFTDVERKLLIDLAFVRQQNESLESVISDLSNLAGEDVVVKLETLQKQNAVLKQNNTTLENSNNYYREEVSKLQSANADLEHTKEEVESKLKSAVERAEQAEAKNKLWFNYALGYQPDDLTLLNKGFWGKTLVQAEVTSEEKAN